MGYARLSTATTLAALLWTLGTGCVATIGAPPEDTGDNRELFADEDEDSLGTISESLITASYPVGSTLRVTATALNLRTGASTDYSVIVVMPNDVRVTLVTSAPRNGWYNIRYGSTTGWASGRYLAVVSTPSTGSETGPDLAISRARSGVGFSYWWGHGRWRPEGPTSSTRGSCSGSCPSCSHSGSYGADCSGYVAKAWSVPSSNTNLTSDAHPYSTYNFYNEQVHWRRISRENIRRADALVYRANGAGHVVLYESGSPWGQLWVYEARGCSAGIQRNLRSFSSSYRTIRRSGY
ncbi:MAG: SH3 domain-containing protein [Sandaracinaceae bacterium]|nr:SH3 domain-containing protein [Sandaracinaceae bacterium]